MTKAETDRIILTWAARYIVGPASMLTLAAFTVGHWYPEIVKVFATLAAQVGLHRLVVSRAAVAELNSAAYMYWLVFWLVLPLNVFWLHHTAIKYKLFAALKVLGLMNLANGLWSPQKYTLRGGVIRFFLGSLLFTTVFIFHVSSAREPSFCIGCESSNPFGFLLINWFGTHVMLFAIYFTGTYLCLWKSIRTTFGERNE